jgi:hypothetical protein
LGRRGIIIISRKGIIIMMEVEIREGEAPEVRIESYIFKVFNLISYLHCADAVANAKGATGNVAANAVSKLGGSAVANAINGSQAAATAMAKGTGQVIIKQFIIHPIIQKFNLSLF